MHAAAGTGGGHDGGGVSSLAYILPSGVIALMLGVALVYVAGPRRARARA